ncbi:MAG: FliM/FliN family flagellar motor switch protein [Aeoliella sp.]
MIELKPEIAPEILAACEANTEDVAGAIARGIDAEVTVAVGEAGTLDRDISPVGFDGPGLAVLLQFGDVGAVALLPAASGLLPDWVAKPDRTGASKLSTLAQELSMLLVPESLLADQFAAAWVEDISAALTSAEVAEAAALVPIELSAGEQAGQLTLVWPCGAPGELLPEAEADEGEASEEVSAENDIADASSAKSASPRPRDYAELPPYARHLLRVEVPVKVTLATKKLSVDEVIELQPGAMINFDKSCEGPLELAVGDQVMAVGSAVKVGDKFGLEISQMTLPEEHFAPVQASRAS